MWEGHEHTEGRYDFTGRFDLPRFLDLCHERGLYVILRMGPYICAEWNFGGFPPYLLEVPKIAIRTDNPPYMDRVRRWFRVLMGRIGDYQATRGGPVILVQVENEYKIVAKRYGEAGRRYLAWLAEVARIQAEMREMFDQLGYPSNENLGELMNRAVRDAGFYDIRTQAGKDRLIAAYEAILDDVNQRLDMALDIRPSAKVVVVGGPMGGYYVPGSSDGTRPGAFHVSLFPHYEHPGFLCSFH